MFCISLFQYYICVDIITEPSYVYNNNLPNICIILQRLGCIIYVKLLREKTAMLPILKEASQVPGLFKEIYGDLAKPGVSQVGKAL